MTKEKRGRAIEIWMTAIARDGGVDRYDDLHIDKIDPLWGSRDLWLQGGLEAYP